mmetsp:Transcript_11653/g.47095  ORF Transcript_11653/g.47095 Transcript_11653/m.47095 type:complete len:249 (-) Transcript_11653:182-928(-)
MFSSMSRTSISSVLERRFCCRVSFIDCRIVMVERYSLSCWLLAISMPWRSTSRACSLRAASSQQTCATMSLVTVSLWHSRKSFAMKSLSQSSLFSSSRSDSSLPGRLVGGGATFHAPLGLAGLHARSSVPSSLQGCEMLIGPMREPMPFMNCILAAFLLLLTSWNLPVPKTNWTSFGIMRRCSRYFRSAGPMSAKPLSTRKYWALLNLPFVRASPMTERRASMNMTTQEVTSEAATLASFFWRASYCS